MSLEFTVFSPEDEAASHGEPVTDDGDSEFESINDDDPEVIEEAFDQEALQELRDAYFDAEEEYIDDDDEEDDDDDDDDFEAEDDDDELLDNEDGDETPNQAATGRQAGGNDEEAIMLNRRATMALLARLQGGLFGGETEYDDLPGRRRNRSAWQRTIAKEPAQAGIDLLNSGEFGEPSASHTIQSSRRFPYSVRAKLLAREFSPYKLSKPILADHFLPTSHGRLAVRYARRAYSGQFSQDGSFFYTCSQDLRVRLYDTKDPTRWRHYKTVLGDVGRWTITDATLSPDNQFVAYSSITPTVYMARTAQDNTDEQEMLDFSGRERMGYSNGIWSIRFSSDGKEIVAGAGDRRMYVYDVESKQVVLGVRGHGDDVNAVCFADESSNVLFSGSDDCLIKVWDRRSMSNKKEAGTLPGHTEGITFISSKGDGRYVLSNGKDQTTKLWDIRKLVSVEAWDRTRQVDYQTGFDYRWQEFPGQVAQKHPDDHSVMTYTGHAILKTLIRCGFSPLATTEQQYVYSGSDCGKLWIWNLDGTVNRTLELGKATEIHRDPQGTRRQYQTLAGGGDSVCIRDAAWHPTLPYMASTSWHSEKDAGSIYLHEFGEGESQENYDAEPVLQKSMRESHRSSESQFWT